MSKRSKRKNRGFAHNPHAADEFSAPVKKEYIDRTPIKPKNERQKQYLNSIRVNTLSLGLGPAGTGKTYLAVTEAAEMLQEGKIDKIIITRPAVEAGESIGFLPGELDEKFAPYFEPVKDILERRLGKSNVEYEMKKGRIIALPLAFMRGKTLDNAFVILDEAQNTTPAQMKLLLTRIGEGSKVVVDGDLKQKDIPGPSGLGDVVERFRNRPSVGVTTFQIDDVVRSGFALEVVRAYEGHRQDDEDRISGQLSFLKDDPQ